MSTAARSASDPSPGPPWAPDEDPRLLFATDTALETARALSEEKDLWSTGSAIEPVAGELVVADRAICLAYDAERDVLFGRDDAHRRYECETTGLLGWVARSGRAVRVDHVPGDPRFDPDLDDPAVDHPAGQDGHERISNPGLSPGPRAPGPFLAVPIRGPSGPVLAGLAVLRLNGATPFSERDQRALEILAAEVYRPLEQLHRESILRQTLERALPGAAGLPTSVGSGADQLFRPEALKQHTLGRADSGDVLRLMPSWTRAAYALLILAVVSLGIAASVLRIDRWLSAPAIVLGSPSELPAAGLSIAALFPGSDRSQLRIGQDLRLQLYDGTVLSLKIESISSTLMGPTAVRQALGPDLSDAISVTGTVAWVEAGIDPGAAVDLYPGWTGQAEVRTGSERVIDALWRGGSDD